MLLIRPHEAIAPLVAITKHIALDQSTNLAVDDRPAHARAPPELGQRELAVRMSQQFRKDRPDRVGTHERRKLRSESLHRTRRSLPVMGRVKGACSHVEPELHHVTARGNVW